MRANYVALLVTLTFASELSANVMHSIGVARDATSESIRYIEHHQYLASGDHRVTYFDPQGEVLVTKQLSYPSLPQHPDILQEDVRRNVALAAKVDGNVVRMSQAQNGQTKNYEIGLDEKVIVDAGFDRYLRENWDLFEPGVSQTYKFAVAGQARLLNVAITKLAQTNATGATTFTIRPTNLLVRIVLPEIRLVYDQARRLSAYSGFTNLKLPQGGSKSVVINFEHYHSSDVLPRPRAEWWPQGLLEARTKRPT